jgi:hypothetical protein
MPLFGTYVATATWNPGGSTAYDVLNALSIDITRGRQGESLSAEMGRCRVAVYDPTGIYNPNNASSPLGANLKLWRGLRVECTPSGGSLTPMFTGFVSRIWHDSRVGVKQTIIEAVDGFRLLDLNRPVIASTGAVLSGAAVGLVLDEAGVAGGLQDLDDGDVLPDFSADGSATGLSVVDDMLAVDRGWYFVTAGGNHAYRSRSSLYGRRTAVATFTTAIGDVAIPALDELNIVNKQTATKTPGGTPQTYSDATSITDYAERQPDDIESAYLLNDNQANSLATWVVLTRKSPDLATRTMFVPGMTLAQVQQQVAREISDPVTLSGLGPATSARVAGLSHRITREVHTTGYTLSLRTSTGFTIGVSVIEGSDVIVY